MCIAESASSKRRRWTWRGRWRRDGPRRDIRGVHANKMYVVPSQQKENLLIYYAGLDWWECLYKENDPPPTLAWLFCLTLWFFPKMLCLWFPQGSIRKGYEGEGEGHAPWVWVVYMQMHSVGSKPWIVMFVKQELSRCVSRNGGWWCTCLVSTISVLFAAA